MGHVAGFFMDFNGAIEKGRKYFGKSREPFTMIVAGQQIYVATSAEDIGRVWNNSKTISMNPLTMDMYVWSGISEKSRKALFDPHPSALYNKDNAKPLTPTQMVIELHHQQLSGARLDALVEHILPALFEKMDFSRADAPAVLSRLGDSFTVSLHELCVNLFVTHETDVFWGKTLRKNSPGIIRAFMDWEYSSWKFLFQLPDMFARDMLKAKSTLTGSFADYYRLPRGQRSDAAHFATALEDMLREVGLSEDEMGKFTMLHYWAVVGNVYKMAFWLVAHLVYKPDVLEQLRDEVLPSVQGASLDEKYLGEQCPKLDSLVNETLRLTVASSLARVVTHTSVVGGKTLKPGNKIMLPIRELHYDPDVWGSNTMGIQPNRFLEDAKLAKSASFRPWGGGPHLCPGRFLARRSLNAFVAILLSKYDVVPLSETFPRADGARPSAGVVPVVLDDDVELRLTPRV